MKTGRTGCLKTLVTTNIWCTTSQKSEDLIYSVLGAWYYADYYLLQTGSVWL